MRNCLLTGLIIFALVGVGVFGNAASSGKKTEASLHVDAIQKTTKHPFDVFMVTDLNGETMKLGDLMRDKVVILNFFATWCPYCREEIPRLNQLLDKFKNKSVLVVGVSLDQNRTLIPPFVQRMGITYPIIVEKNPMELASALNAFSLPTTFIINPSGDIVMQRVGNVPFELYLDVISKILKKP